MAPVVLQMGGQGEGEGGETFQPRSAMSWRMTLVGAGRGDAVANERENLQHGRGREGGGGGNV